MDKRGTWKEVEEHLASEIINDAERISKAKDIGCICLTVLMILMIIGGGRCAKKK